MGRIKLNEISVKRIGYALARRITDIPETFAWNARTGLAAENRARLEQYRNKHAGERCFILGNGPSLKKTDLSLLKREISFGLIGFICSTHYPSDYTKT